MPAVECVLVSHTHWDREWYRTFQAFRARLVDTIDRVLELLDADPGWSFVLDGQAAVLEDYVEIRPQRADALEAACRAGRIGIGPWYVQPDSLLPSGESHVRNLREGRELAPDCAAAKGSRPAGTLVAGRGALRTRLRGRPAGARHRDASPRQRQAILPLVRRFARAPRRTSAPRTSPRISMPRWRGCGRSWTRWPPAARSGCC